MAKDVYHNALGGNSADQLRGVVHRVERLEEEIDALNGDKRELYAEAKACGFCKKTLRKLIIRRKKDKTEVEEADAILDLYEAALMSGELAERERDPLEY